MKFRKVKKSEIRKSSLQSLEDEIMEQISAGKANKTALIVVSCISAVGAIASTAVIIDENVKMSKIKKDIEHWNQIYEGNFSIYHDEKYDQERRIMALKDAWNADSKREYKEGIYRQAQFGQVAASISLGIMSTLALSLGITAGSIDK